MQPTIIFNKEGVYMYFIYFLRDVLFHSLKVAFMNFNYAVFISLSTKDTFILFCAGLFHDIGKIKINKKILFSKKKLTDYEKNIIISKHSLYSFLLFKNFFSFFKFNQIFLDILFLIKHHHSKEEISRNNLLFILHFNDCMDSLISKRVYKNKLNTKEAVSIILKNINL